METEDRNIVERPVRPLDRRTTRRDAVKAGAAVAVGVAAAGYVKPTLRGLGVPVALATSGALPPPGPETAACTPGYWGNSPKGKDLWDVANDSAWGGVSAEPFIGSTIFGSYFTPVLSSLDPTNLMGQTMLYFASNGATSNPVEQAARDVVAGSLNAAYFGSGFGYSLSQIQSAWTGAVNTYNSSGGTDASGLQNLHTTLDAANNAAQCPL